MPLQVPAGSTEGTTTLALETHHPHLLVATQPPITHCHFHRRFFRILFFYHRRRARINNRRLPDNSLLSRTTTLQMIFFGRVGWMWGYLKLSTLGQTHTQPCNFELGA
ncbi:Uncharacterized protein Fot_37310 [Forsythia ovata]|uniref:Uncharacterized protein n=1 Tax=Forsythia ovata TaxID=205694 RepID=A0ABD1S0S9_9LAMI